MKYVEKHTPVDERTEILFNKNAKQINSETKEKSYAKVIVKNDRETYYIRVYQSVPLDPLGSYGNRTRDLQTKMTPVSKGTFDFYMLYLKTNNSVYMTRARNMILMIIVIRKANLGTLFSHNF